MSNHFAERDAGRAGAPRLLVRSMGAFCALGGAALFLLAGGFLVAGGLRDPKGDLLILFFVLYGYFLIHAAYRTWFKLSKRAIRRASILSISILCGIAAAAVLPDERPASYLSKAAALGLFVVAAVLARSLSSALIRRVIPERRDWFDMP